MKSNAIVIWVGILFFTFQGVGSAVAASGDVEGAAWAQISAKDVIIIFVALISSLTSYILSIKKAGADFDRLKREYQLDFAAERVAQNLMKDEKWKLRSFRVIKHHLGGFEDDDLRKILIRAGAIRFKSASGQELWGLFERNRHRLGQLNIDDDPGERLLNLDGDKRT